MKWGTRGRRVASQHKIYISIHINTDEMPSFNTASLVLNFMGKTYSVITHNDEGELNVIRYEDAQGHLTGKGYVIFAAGEDEDGYEQELVVCWNNERVTEIRLYIGNEQQNEAPESVLQTIQLIK